jgi:hypothetical protein
MKEFILKENVLSDDTLLIANKNKIFKGGFIAIIKINTFLNAWSDKQEIKRFRSKEKLFSFLYKNYKGFDDFDFTDTCLN